MIREGVTTVFTEELVSPAVARTLAREAGATTAVLDPLESARAPRDPGYVARMDDNLAAVRSALSCA
jgi:zinc transport system substrate-binding protein